MLQETQINQDVKFDKSKYVKGIFINVYEHSVSEHLFRKNKDGDVDLRELYEAIGCDLVERMPLNKYGFYDDSHDLIMDEEGLFKPTPGCMMGKSVILGNSVIFSIDWEKGRWQDAHIQVNEVISKIVWLDTQTATSIARQM